jgi:hypothetical protein
MWNPVNRIVKVEAVEINMAVSMSIKLAASVSTLTRPVWTSGCIEVPQDKFSCWAVFKFN